MDNATYQADRSLCTMSNIAPLSSKGIDPIRDILQRSLFATSSRPEFTEHPHSRYMSKRCNNSNLKTVFAHLPFLESSSLNPDCSSSLTLTEHETEETNESFLRTSCVNMRNNVNRRNRSFSEAKSCKQCNFIANTKMEYWEHMRRHIKGFTCSECSFVTKYKHHMNHHWLSVHDGSKPFKCKKCLYTCVSKSMLTSHLKKHSNVYPYRCADCTYKTKFCNALKKHLRKKEHQPAMVLNSDGSPNPLSIVDVYGTKRGPKRQKPHAIEEQEEPNGTPFATITNDQLDSITCPLLSLHSPVARGYLTVAAINGINNGHWINQNGINKNQSVTNLFPYSDLVAAFNLSNHVSFHQDATFYENVMQKKTDYAQSSTLTEYVKILNVEDKMPKVFAQSLPVIDFDTNNDIDKHDSSEQDISRTTNKSLSTFRTVQPTQLERQKTESTDIPLDLRMAKVIRKNQFHQFKTLTRIGANSPKVIGTSKRKGKAIKLKHRIVKGNMDKKSERNKNIFFEALPDSKISFHQINQRIENIKNEVITNLFDIKFTCHYCEIIFGNVIMYAVHMGCHSFDDPYTCNICGQQCIDKLSFFLHIARTEH